MPHHLFSMMSFRVLLALTGEPAPKMIGTPEGAKYVPMAMAFSLIHSGAMPTADAPPMSPPSPPSPAMGDVMVRIRELSTQEPRWSTGGMPMASQTSRRPGPAFSSAFSGVMYPALAEAMAEQPVWSTSTSFLMSSRVRKL